MKSVEKNKLDIELENTIKNWSPGIQWTEEELNSIIKILKNIGAQNQSLRLSDKKIEDSLLIKYIINRINIGIEKILRLYAQSIKSKKNNGYYLDESKSNKNNKSFKFLNFAKYSKKIDINSAPLEELLELPGLGEATAKRLIGYRQSIGLIQTLDELKIIKGFSNTNIELFKNFVTIGRESGEIYFSNKSFEKFKEDPTFSNYIELIKKMNGIFVPYEFPWYSEKIFENDNIKRIIYIEIKKILGLLENNRYNKYLYFKKASKINNLINANLVAKDIELNSSKDINGVSILDNTQYFFFLKKALKEAKKKIFIIMFFMRFEEEKKYPINEVIDILLTAHKKGIDIKIILDKDAEGDVYKSRIINNEVYKYLVENGIPVVHDSERYVTHSKCLIIDDVHTIIGSHNWTSGSFFAYDDKSIYIESKDFNEKCSSYFITLWNKYNNIIPIKDMKSFDNKFIKELEENGIIITKNLLNELKTKNDREKFAKKYNKSKGDIIYITNILDLIRIDGINEGWAILLEKCGVDSAKELSKRNPDNLYDKIETFKFNNTYGKIVIQKPSKDQIEYWIQQAKSIKKIIIY